jgi:hypothetical protein
VTARLLLLALLAATPSFAEEQVRASPEFIEKLTAQIAQLETHAADCERTASLYDCNLAKGELVSCSYDLGRHMTLLGREIYERLHARIDKTIAPMSKGIAALDRKAKAEREQHIDE